jgi:O-acetyl-ADP-ribose deacetylase (regulator of RNase III)
VLHTVGPIVEGGRVGPDDERALASSYRSCLELVASLRSIRTLAFCAISTGVFGYPKDRAAATAVEVVSAWVREHEGVVGLVVFNVFSDADEEAYEMALAGRGKDRWL